MAKSFKESTKIEVGEVKIDSDVEYNEGTQQLVTVMHFTKKNFEKAKSDKEALEVLLCGIDGEEIAKFKKWANQSGDTEAVDRVNKGIKKLASKSADLSDAILSGAFDFGNEDKKDYTANINLKSGKAVYTFGVRKLLKFRLDDEAAEAFRDYVDFMLRK